MPTDEKKAPEIEGGVYRYHEGFGGIGGEVNVVMVGSKLGPVWRPADFQIPLSQELIDISPVDDRPLDVQQAANMIALRLDTEEAKGKAGEVAIAELIAEALPKNYRKQTIVQTMDLRPYLRTIIKHPERVIRVGDGTATNLAEQAAKFLVPLDREYAEISGAQGVQGALSTDKVGLDPKIRFAVGGQVNTEIQFGDEPAPAAPAVTAPVTNGGEFDATQPAPTSLLEQRTGPGAVVGTLPTEGGNTGDDFADYIAALEGQETGATTVIDPEATRRAFLMSGDELAQVHLAALNPNDQASPAIGDALEITGFQEVLGSIRMPTKMSANQWIEYLYDRTPKEMKVLEQNMKDAGIYDELREAPTFTGDKHEAVNRRAWILLLQKAVQQGMPIDQLIVEQTAKRKEYLRQTGLPEETWDEHGRPLINNAGQAVGYDKSGAQYVLEEVEDQREVREFSNPADIGWAADGRALDLLDRQLTDQERAYIVSAVNEAERMNYDEMAALEKTGGDTYSFSSKQVIDTIIKGMMPELDAEGKPIGPLTRDQFVSRISVDPSRGIPEAEAIAEREAMIPENTPEQTRPRVRPTVAPIPRPERPGAPRPRPVREMQ